MDNAHEVEFDDENERVRIFAAGIAAIVQARLCVNIPACSRIAEKMLDTAIAEFFYGPRCDPQRGPPK